MARLDKAPRLTLINGEPHLVWGDEVIKVPRLKHGALFLMSGYIGSQLFGCEYKLHLDYSRGRIITRPVIHGMLEHSRQLGVDEEGIGMEPGWNSVLINRGEEGVYFFNEKMKNWIGYADFNKPYVQEVSLVMVRNNVPILGLPDLVINSDGKPYFILELKTTNKPRNLRVLRRQEEFQAISYFHMMRYLNLNPVGVGVLKVLRNGGFRLLNNVDSVIKGVENRRGGDVVKLSSDAVLHVINPGDYEDFIKNVDRAIEYWLGSRNPVPNPNAGLCRVCEHRGICPFARY
ncbi:PD-(D/E)XK nuclease family protein [Vulcanisaeta thermophila]|uniref:PD-(D/E)XK nuclease family protein n=1 Tax=Vulcanisaeta thermophila TaxID=867917 RepID=UPI00085359AA|nr:PD-(D/E)XK nuclease family protein [Vulcanisaeta thermophila]